MPTHRPDSHVKRRFRVTGKVQGVYFRHSARLEAERLGLCGVARNMPDGSVEVVAHGASGAVETLREWLQRGPAMARVARVEELKPDPDDARADAQAAATPTAFSVE